MTNLYNYITEKLKLSDIKKDVIGVEWVDARKYKKIEDILKEGYIVEVRGGFLYLVVRTFLAKKIKPDIAPTTEFVLLRKVATGYGWVNPDSFEGTYPKCKSAINDDFDIVKVKTRQCKFKNAVEAIQELLNIAKKDYL